MKEYTHYPKLNVHLHIYYNYYYYHFILQKCIFHFFVVAKIHGFLYVNDFHWIYFSIWNVYWIECVEFMNKFELICCVEEYLIVFRIGMKNQKHTKSIFNRKSLTFYPLTPWFGLICLVFLKRKKLCNINNRIGSNKWIWYIFYIKNRVMNIDYYIINYWLSIIIK